MLEMTNQDVNKATEALLRRKIAQGTNRRQLLTRAGMIGAAVLGANMMGSRRSMVADATEVTTFKPSSGKGFRVNSVDILRFALNLEYLEATYFCHAAFGLDINDVAGQDVSSGAGEGALVGTLPTTPNSFISPSNQRLAQELALIEVAHIQQLRTVLGRNVVGRPSLDIPGGFTKEYTALGDLTSSGAPATFDPFSGDAGFLVGAFAFEDVGATAYNGAAPYLSGELLAAAASILAAESYHAGATRYALYNYSISFPTTVGYLPAIANAIISLEDLASAEGNPTPPPTGQQLLVNGTAFFVNADPTTGLVYARNFGQVLNIVYVSTAATPTPGGFYPNGFNGRIK